MSVTGDNGNNETRIARIYTNFDIILMTPDCTGDSLAHPLPLAHPMGEGSRVRVPRERGEGQGEGPAFPTPLSPPVENLRVNSCNSCLFPPVRPFPFPPHPTLRVEPRIDANLHESFTGARGIAVGTGQGDPGPAEGFPLPLFTLFPPVQNIRANSSSEGLRRVEHSLAHRMGEGQGEGPAFPVPLFPLLQERRRQVAWPKALTSHRTPDFPCPPRGPLGKNQGVSPIGTTTQAVLQWETLQQAVGQSRMDTHHEWTQIDPDFLQKVTKKTKR